MPSFPNSSSMNSGAAAPAAIGRSVLIADDHEDTRLMLRTMLEMNSFYVLEAADGKEAVELAELERPDIVLMDFGLPILDGLTALPLIRASETICDGAMSLRSCYAELGPR